MATTLKVAVKMYRIGELGDCFMLTFTKGTKQSNMLIDCGAFRQSRDRLRKIASNIKTQLKGKPLDIIVGTHQHNDHVNGFVHAKDIFESIGVEQVWLSWLDNPKDKLAREVGTLYNNFKKNLLGIAETMESLPDKVKKQGFRETSEKLKETLGILGLSDRKVSSKFPSVTPQEAIANLKEMGNNKPEYLYPGTILPLPNFSAEDVKIYVLGPPKKEEFLFDESPGKEQTYDPKKLHFANELAEKFLSGMANYIPEASTTEEDHFPFNSRYKTKEEALPVHFRQLYREEKSKWRTISLEWLSQAESLALFMDNFTNNSSLVLAIELVKSGKFLLFVGDAMTGNWASWEEVKFKDSDLTLEDILANTVLYKVGHHGSHNASFKPFCEKMVHEDLIAMIPVDKSDSNIKKTKNPWHMPAKNLNKRLIELTRNRIMRMDDIYDKQCKPDKEPAKSSWKKSGVKVRSTEFFIEALITDTK